MGSWVLWSTFIWTLKGLLCTWRFFWVNPYCTKLTPWMEPNLERELRSVEKKTKEKSPECVLGRIQGCEGSTFHNRLLQTEGEIQDLKAQIVHQKASWEMRFMELQRKQHELRDQLHSELVIRWSSLNKAAVDSENISENIPELQWHHVDRHCSGELIPEHNEEYLSSQSSRSTSALSGRTSVGSWRSGPGPHRAFVPHSPMDLQIGHRVRVLLPSGRISTGTLQYLGQLHGSSELCLGVELEQASNGLQTGTYEGQMYFKSKPGHGAFVAFSKLLMAWE